MDWLNIITVSFTMAIDCMTVGATDGMKEPKMKVWKILFISFIFGLFQGIMPLIGYFIGSTFKQYIEKAIPWIAFSLLLLLGIKNIVEWIKDRVKDKKKKEHEKENTNEIENIKEEEEEHKTLKIKDILIQGIATSIDALSIGFVYLSLPINSALLVFLIIGVFSFVLPIITILLGKFIGKFLEKWSSLIAGIVFIAVGLKILLEGILTPSEINMSFLMNHLPV